MIIGMDGNEANQKVRTGSGVYAFELLRQLKKIRIQNLEFRIYLKDEPISELPPANDYWKYAVIGPKKFWTQITLPLYLWKEKIRRKVPDVFFSPTHYAPRFCPIPSVITIFDLSFIRFPEMFLKADLYKLQNWTKYSVVQAKKIITISEFSKKEINDNYHISADKIIVAYPGYDQDRFNKRIKNKELKIRNIKKKYKISSPYILFVGTIQPRKNISRLIDAFRLLNNEYPELKLVICGMVNEGRGGWMNAEILNLTKNNITITGYVENEDLPYLMAEARVFVLPSLYEGFGIPAVEAMACGTPTVVSNISSLSEIVGNAAFLIDPYDIDSIVRGIKEACYNKLKQEEMIQKGLLQARKYNWENSAKLILNTLLNL